jgi:O-antigen/teichoic acid export membrane protein
MSRLSNSADPANADPADAAPGGRAGARTSPFRLGDGALGRLACSLADQAVVSGASFASGVIVGKFTSKEQFGLYGLGFTLVMIAAELQSALVSTPQTMFGPRYAGERYHQFQGSMLLKLLLLAICNASLLGLGAVSTAAAGLSDLSAVLGALAVGVTSMHLGTFARVACFAHLNPLGALLVDLFSCGGQLIALVLLWRFDALSAWTAWLAIHLTTLPPALVWLALWRRHMRFSPAGAREDFSITWRQTRFVLVSSLLWVAGIQLYPWMLEVFADRAAVAIWTACFGVAAIGNPLMYGLMNMLGPQIAHRRASLPVRQFRRYAAWAIAAFSAVMAAFALVVSLLGDWLLVNLYTPEYGGHGLVVALLAFGLVARVPGFVASRGLFVLNRADLELLNNLAPIGVLLVMGVAMTARFGVTGAAVSLLAAQAIGSITRVICFDWVARDEAKLGPTDDAPPAMGVNP